MKKAKPVKAADKKPIEPTEGRIQCMEFTGVDFDYRRDRSGCRCDGICRCSRIVDEKVRTINIKEIAEQLNREYDTQVYGTIKLLIDAKAHEPEAWLPNIRSGYYGQDLYDAKLNDSIVKKVNAGLKEMQRDLTKDYENYDFTQHFEKEETLEERFNTGNFVFDYSKKYGMQW